MKKLLVYIIFCFLSLPVFAKHIIGGEMIYQYLGRSTNGTSSKYRIILKLFRDQNSPSDAAAMPADVFIGIFNRDNGSQFPNPGGKFDVFRSDEEDVSVNPFPTCITSPPSLNYHVGRYILEVELPDNKSGYTAAYQTCCRVSPIENIFNSNGNSAGSTFFCNIPPVNDSSPEFATSIDAICGGKPFTLKFGAKDPDKDSLVYAFTNAYDGGPNRNATNENPLPPPYNPVDYINGYSYTMPLGPLATIDSRTGTISGRAPQVGRYVVAVVVYSYRNGLLVSDHNKDFIVNVTNCDFAGVRLDPRPVSCDGFDVKFSNDDYTPLNKTFYWDFGDPSTGTADTSTLANPTHIYSDTGTYVYKLVVNRGDECSDSATQTVKVYPGFAPDFDVDGRCINSPIYFKDKSTTKYGSINSWRWDFGDAMSTADTSVTKNSQYTFLQPGAYPVKLTITSTKGCLKSYTDTVQMLEKPPFDITGDTLICSIDTLQLNASGSGSISWSPNYNISNLNSFNPKVSPDKTTTYYASYSESRGCNATDSVKINVVNVVTLRMPKDTTICLSDSIQLFINTDGLQHLWTPTSSVVSDTAQNPIVVPSATTTYHVVATIGKCNTSGNVQIKTIPYPAAKTIADTGICISKSIQLLASGGTLYKWSPNVFLDNSNIPNPVSTPSRSIQYIVQVNDVLGCPKPGFDTVMITVDKPFVDAGPRDTAIVKDQPLQLFANGAAEFFTWTPPTGLNNPNIQNPEALLSENQQYIVKILTAAGCTATDTIMVRVYKLKPGFFVPNAFTPNGDGLNDDFKPIPIGMKSMKYFRVYNRDGILIFSTNRFGDAWDGAFKGSPQDTGTFVWTALGEDYLGNIVSEKGTVTLIR